MRIDVDFTNNPSQKEFVETVLAAAAGRNNYRFIMTGGAIRGGKTIAALATLCLLCAIYPGSKWIIYRKDFPSLMDTTIPSMEKIVEGLPQWKWHKAPSNFYVEYSNKSKIYFYGENISQDSELDAILGLECNGVLLEQCEELSEKLFTKIQSRLGSHYIKNMPKPLLLLTVNPTQYWPKAYFYEPWRKGALKEPYYFVNALTKHNTYVTAEQWKLFDNLDERNRRSMIEGDWTDMRSKDDLWAYAFDRDKHFPQGWPMVPPMLDKAVWSGDNNHYLYLSFDFNRNPITCCVIQHYNDTVYVLEQIKLANSDIYRLCDRIRTTYPAFTYIVTGDASGQSSSAMVKDNLNYYKIISSELRVGPAMFKLPSVNPKLEDNQVLVNSILARYKVLLHPEKAKALVYDFENVRYVADGAIVKTNRNDPAQQADALDSFRYWCNQFMKNFIRLKSV